MAARKVYRDNNYNLAREQALEFAKGDEDYSYLKVRKIAKRYQQKPLDLLIFNCEHLAELYGYTLDEVVLEKSAYIDFGNFSSLLMFLDLVDYCYEAGIFNPSQLDLLFRNLFRYLSNKHLLVQCLSEQDGYRDLTQSSLVLIKKVFTALVTYPEAVKTLEFIIQEYQNVVQKEKIVEIEHYEGFSLSKFLLPKALPEDMQYQAVAARIMSYFSSTDLESKYREDKRFDPTNDGFIRTPSPRNSPVRQYDRSPPRRNTLRSQEKRNNKLMQEIFFYNSQQAETFIEMFEQK